MRERESKKRGREREEKQREGERANKKREKRKNKRGRESRKRGEKQEQKKRALERSGERQMVWPTATAVQNLPVGGRGCWGSIQVHWKCRRFVGSCP